MTRKTARSQSDDVDSQGMSLQARPPFQNRPSSGKQALVLVRTQSIDRRFRRGTTLDLDDGQNAAPAGKDVDLTGTTAQAKAEDLIAAQHQPESGKPFGAVALPMSLLTKRLPPGRLGPGGRLRSADPARLHPRP